MTSADGYHRGVRVALLALVVGAAVLAGPLATPAGAQDVNAAVADLRDHDVTFEEGAVDDRDIAELDATAAALDEGVEVKIVVLGDPVGDKFTSTRDFAQQVLLGLGDGERRVVVYDPGDVGIASNVDSADEIEQAERAAIDAANRSDSFADGAQAAVTVLRADEEGAAAPAAAEDEGDGFPWGVVLLLLVVIAVVVLVVVWFLRRSSRRADDAGCPPSRR